VRSICIYICILLLPLVCDAQMAEIKLILASREAVKTELTLSNQVSEIKGYLAADVDSLFSNLTKEQLEFLKVQHALLRALVKSDDQIGVKDAITEIEVKNLKD